MSKIKRTKTEPVDPETLAAIENIIDVAECCKNAFYWTNNGNARSRRRKEEMYNCPTVEWEDGDDQFSARYVFSQSRNHTYAHGEYYRNGERTTLTAIRNSYKRLLEAAKSQSENDQNT